MSDLKDMTETFMREKVQELLDQCNPRQQLMFHRLYPNGPTVKQLPNAYNQCKRTIEKNKRPGPEPSHD